jgi:hypothetical protein
MATKKNLKTLDIKKITRITNIGVLLLSGGILFLSGWFLMSSLNENQAGSAIDSSTGIGIETLDLKQLEKVLKNLSDKRAGNAESPRTRNPFIGQAAPAPQPPPAPLPEPALPPPT